MYLLGSAESSSPVHVILRVHDEHHLVGVELEATVDVAGALHPDQPLPGALDLAAQGPHLLALPLAKLLQVSGTKQGRQSTCHILGYPFSSADRAHSTSMELVFACFVF